MYPASCVHLVLLMERIRACPASLLAPRVLGQTRRLDLHAAHVPRQVLAPRPNWPQTMNTVQVFWPDSGIM